MTLNLQDLIIDALYGTGFSGQPKGIAAEIFNLVNNCRTPVVSVDLPSGLNATTGMVEGSAIRADLTVALGFLKTGLVLYPGREYCGKNKTSGHWYPT